MKREYIKPSVIVTSFETIDTTSINLVQSAAIAPTTNKGYGYTSNTFRLHS